MKKATLISAVILAAGLFTLPAQSQSIVDPGVSVYNYKHPNKAAKAKALGYDARIFDSQNNTALESDHFDNIIVSGFEAILFNPTDANGSVANVLKISAFCPLELFS